MKLCRTCNVNPRYIRQAVCQDCANKRRRKNYKANSEPFIAQSKKFRVERKQRTIEAYGGKCTCCGESLLGLLSIDHIDGKGCEHRRTLGHVNMYDWLKQNNYPEGFRVLCFNCNMGRAHHGGICPHELQGDLTIYYGSQC